MKIRKKPIIVNAVQWFEPDDERHAPEHIIVRKPTGKVGEITCDSGGLGVGPPHYFIKTVQHAVRLNSGDWLLTDPSDGDSWPVSDALIREKYEVVEP